MAARRARIFHCDDNAGFRLLTRLTLAGEGRAPDVVLMDGLTSQDSMWRRLRRLLPDAQLLLYSGLPEPQLSEKGTALGADGCLPKDAPSGELAALVSRLLNR